MNEPKKEKNSKIKLDDDQIEEVTGGTLDDVGVEFSDAANPLGGIARTKTFEYDEKARQNG